MKRWLTLTEIADAALPGLPGTRRGVAKRATAEGWARRPRMSRKRIGSGGGIEFSIELLPEEARVALLAKQDGQPVSDTSRPAIQLRADDPLQGDERIRRDAKLFVLAEFDRFADENRVSLGTAAKLFSGAWALGTINAPAWVREVVPTVCRATIFSWRATRRDHGDDALGHDGRGRPATIDKVAGGAVRAAALGAIARQNFLSAGQLAAHLRHVFDEMPELSLRTMQRTRSALEDRHRNELLAIRDPDTYRSRIELSGTSAILANGLNDLWEIDASPADVMLRGKRRHSIYMAIDLWSRRTVVLVTQSPRADAVAQLLRKCILKWGLPRRVKTDNGSDFVAKATQRLMTALEIEHEIAPPYSPKSKGHVERVIGTFQRGLAVCPGFIGHSVADRKVIESRKAFARRLGMQDEQIFEVELELAEFQSWCDTWADQLYGQTVHGTIRQTPALRAASWVGDVRRIAHPEALDILLAAVPGKDGIRRVTKQGIRIEGEYYLTSAAWPGADVLVRMDPADLGRASVFAVDGETYLGEALCPMLAGIDPVAASARVKAAQKAHEKEATAAIRKEMRKITPRTFMDAMQAQADRQSASLVYLDRQGSAVSTPSLDAARAAVDARNPKVEDYRPEDLPQVPASVLRMPPRRAAPQTSRTDQVGDFRRAVDLEDKIARGELIAGDDADWLRSYQTHPDYKAGMRIYRQRGRAMFG